jgi:hypothetical protein
MATIKLQNGKVITKSGKVSCGCCAPPCNLCENVLVSAPLLEIIQNSTSVSVTYDFPEFANNEHVFGTEILPWNGVSAYIDIEYDGFIQLTKSGNCFNLHIMEFSAAARNISFYTTGIDCGFPTDPLFEYKLFTIPINSSSVNAFQYIIFPGGEPPGFYPAPTASISFS